MTCYLLEERRRRQISNSQFTPADRQKNIHNGTVEWVKPVVVNIKHHQESPPDNFWQKILNVAGIILCR